MLTYNDFSENTGLKDNIYETIFSNVIDLFNKINEVKWIYFTYSNKDAYDTKPFLINFSREKQVPLYVIELIKNSFENYYTVPKTDVITIGISYNNKEHTIVSSNEGTDIPNEISFLRDIYHLFFMTHPVRDIFEEQENVFKFLNKYKSTQREVFPALAKRFELKNSKNATESLDINSKQLMEEKLLIKTLEDKVSHLISELDKVKVERENLESVKNDIFNGVKNRDSLLAEKEKYSNEYKMLVDTKEYYETRLEQLNTIIETIDAELHYLLDRGGDSDSIRQLQDKKTIFDYERTSIEKNLKNISLISRQTSDSINIINKEIERIEKYDENDVKDLINKIEEMAQKQDYKYKELVESESKLKGLKVKNNNKQLQFEQSHTYIDSSIQNIESGSIINYLTSNTQPAAISAVMRYIRDYFCYYTTLVSGNIMKALPNQNIYITQAIATRLVLMDYFGINFNNLFSVFDFDHASLKNLILITKD